MFEDVDEGHLDGEEKIVYRYNREERLKSAPQIVRDFYDGKLEPVRGFKVLWVNKSNRFILLALVFFVGFIWINSGIRGNRNTAVVDDIKLELMAFSYEDEVYVNLKIDEGKKKELSSPVNIKAEIYFTNVDSQVVEKKELSLVYNSGEEYLRTKVSDYDIIMVDAFVQVGEVQKDLSTSVKR